MYGKCWGDALCVGESVKPGVDRRHLSAMVGDWLRDRRGARGVEDARFARFAG